jgi:hypothetical protein
MSELSDYIQNTVVRGECCCGQCSDAVADPENHQPNGHVADVFFFKVAANPDNPPQEDDLRRLAAEHKGEYGDCNPFDNKEHSFIELGGWLGDQGLALMFMGAAALTGIVDVLSPKMLPGLPDDLMQMMAGQGMVSINAKTQGA